NMKKVKTVNRVLTVARFCWLACRVGWPWFRFYPLAATATAMVGLALLALVPVAAPAAGVILAGGVWFDVHRSGSRARLNRATGSVLGAVFWWRWPSQIHRAELDRVVSGRARGPRVRKIRVDAVDWSHWGLLPSIGRVRAEIVPLDAQLPREWPEIARRIQTRNGFASHSYRPHGETRFRVAYASAVLPELAPFQGADWLARTQDHTERVELGYTGNIDASEPWMYWELDAFPHRMINGKTGGGKSTPMRCAQLHGVVTGAELFVFSGKKSGEFG
ncbi:MAG: hypothetical protein GY926_25660, partial [bacterium]|nr:hypothetical protein [bacterium]